MNKWDNKESGQLFRAIASIRTDKEAKCFLRDLLTEEEIAEFSNRWQAAQLLYSKVPYSTIAEKTGLSSATIARVSRWLWRGMNGYQTILKRLVSHHSHVASTTAERP